MTDSSIQKLRLTVLVALLGLLPLPAMASTVDIYRYSTQGDRVTLRVRVLDDERVPIQGLNREDFQIETTDAQDRPVTLNPSQTTLVPPERQSNLDPAYLVILLDMSGSMAQKDLGGEKKLKGATDGIRDFITEIRREKLPVQISLVPYGEKGNAPCQYTYQVNQSIIKQNLLKAMDRKLDEQLNVLAKLLDNVCAATNIYQPVAEAVSYLGTPNRFGQIQSDPNAPKPRLAVIFLSDGFDVYRSNETERFKNLLDVLQQNRQVTVHSMGYGERLRELRDRARCPLSDAQLTVDNVRLRCRLPGADITEFIVDEQRLRAIAQATGGIHKFPGNPREVVETLRTFLTTLREYEIIYQQPGADRASPHKTVVRVNSSSRQLNKLASEPKNIRMGNFIYSSLPFPKRLAILGFTTLLGLAGVLSFMSWSKRLKEQAERNL
ncbi:MAG: vWA domain-containing protein [Cyanobacteriota bacterium]